MSAFPIHAALEKDFLVQLIVVDANDSMDQVAEKVAYHCVNRRVKPRKGVMRVRRHRASELFPREMTVAESGLKPTEVIDVVFE
ncbi:toluene-4-monooxygenase system hydroxylase subunit gamma TmoB [Alteromonas antoniana]|jgi:toluene monooxygenase system protein B|uniref:toluene-4-monooxygenase system hydroxylase subunit gamma TmoB n=1 Tax=Alteromonas antoniana TaxID=2803813 RepID=UPI001C47CB90|nr:toluene-4-monooxygenase system hydroxylase subunit gamma TmoB [Alteromonas antoniana]